MPKGVYDRSKAKKKTSTEKTFATATATVFPKKHVTRKAAINQLAPKTAARFDSPTVSQAPHDLYTHLREITATRTGLSGGADHNPQVLGTIDAEIQATFAGLRSWREANYPTNVPTAAKTDNGASAKQAQVEAPVVKQQAAPYVPPTPPAPLPFTPQAVQDVLKQTS